MLLKLSGIFQAFSPQIDCNVKVLLRGKRSTYIHLIFHLLIPESFCAIPLGVLIKKYDINKEGGKVAFSQYSKIQVSLLHIRGLAFIFSCLKFRSISD